MESGSTNLKRLSSLNHTIQEKIYNYLDIDDF